VPLPIQLDDYAVNQELRPRGLLIYDSPSAFQRARHELAPIRLRENLGGAMSKKDAVLIVSRAAALYLFCWAFDALSFLPERILAAQRQTGVDFHRLYIVALEATVLRGVVLLGAAMLFYECGPRVQAFLFPSYEQTDAKGSA
jgi:hypothetical protein